LAEKLNVYNVMSFHAVSHVYKPLRSVVIWWHRNGI